jgi:hypothetical protein
MCINYYNNRKLSRIYTVPLFNIVVMVLLTLNKMLYMYAWARWLYNSWVSQSAEFIDPGENTVKTGILC